MKFFLFLIVGIFFCINVHAQDKPIAFKGALVYPITSKPIQNGTVIVQNGKIIAVGDASLKIPLDAVITDSKGKVIMPGIVDTHSHLGGPEGGDYSAALNPDARAFDAINPTSDGFKKALAGGLTTLNIMPGSGHLMSGQTVYAKMREAKVMEDLILINEKGLFGGMKMANGTNPMRGTGGFPATRAKSAAMDRDLFNKAREYKIKLEKAGKDSTKLPERDLRLEPLVEVLEGKRVVHFHTHKENDILTAIRLIKEFGFRAVLHHVSEGWKVSNEIAKAGVPCSIIVIESPGGKLEALDYSSTNGAALSNAGVLTGFHTDDGVTDSRLLIRAAAMGVRAGMDKEKALEALTINGAKMLDLSSRIGSLEKGKDADFIILSGDPFSLYTKVEQTWVEGKKRYDITNPADKAFLVGGFKVYSSLREEYMNHDDEIGN